MAASLADLTCQQTTITCISSATGAAHESRMRRFDQLAVDTASMWSMHLVSPTQMAAHAMRTAAESGSGRTRIEANHPDVTSGQRAA